MERFPLHIPGTYVVLWSMMDIAAYANDEWNIRPLKEHEVDALEEVAKALSLVISLIVMAPESNQMDFVAEAARQWDFNIDTFVRKLEKHGVLFVQPHSWDDIEYDKNKYVLATARNTVTIMIILRMCLRLSDAYIQLRCYKLGCCEPYNCATCDVGHWMLHGTENATEDQRSSPFIRDAVWQQKYRDIVLRPCILIDIDILTSLYRRDGLCINDDELLPFVRAKHRRFVFFVF